MEASQIDESLEQILQLAKCKSVYAKSSVQTGLQASITFRNQKSKIDEIILTQCFAAEKMCPGTMTQVLQKALLLNKDSTQSLDYQKSDVGFRADYDDILALIDEFITDDLAKDALKEALLLSGFNGKILIEKSKDQRCVVQQILGCTFQLNQLTKKKEIIHNPKILVIDGMIESVSEIHHIFSWLNESKHSAVLFVRSLSDDVLNTINVNNARKTLDVIVYRANFDIEHANTLVDVATVSGARFISTLTGDLISSIDVNSDFGNLDKIYVDTNSVTLTTRSNNPVVLQHLSTLRKNRDSETLEIKQRVLDARIKSVTPAQVVLKLPDDIFFVQRSQQIDYTLRAIKSAVDWGIKRNEGITLAANDLVVNIYAKKLIKSLRDMIIV